MKSCKNCKKHQYGHIKAMMNICKDCARLGLENPPDRISFWRQFFSGTIDFWQPADPPEVYQRHLDIMAGRYDPY